MGRYVPPSKGRSTLRSEKRGRWRPNPLTKMMQLNHDTRLPTVLLRLPSRPCCARAMDQLQGRSTGVTIPPLVGYLD